MTTSNAERMLATPSAFCREHFLYVQEAGSLISLEPHRSSRKNLDSCLFFIVLEGTGTLQYKEQLFELESGDCVFIDCHHPYYHESNAEYPWKLKWVHFWGNQAPAFYHEYLKNNFSPVFKANQPELFSEYLDSICHELKEQNTLTELNCNRYLTDLITLCFHQNSQQLSDTSSIQVKLHHIREYIAVHFTEKLTLDSLAQDFYISKFHLAREYHKTFGITLGNEITARRINKAKSLLRFSNASVETISMVSGFSDVGYFIKVFKKEESMTPLEYRKKWAK